MFMERRVDFPCFIRVEIEFLESFLWLMYFEVKLFAARECELINLQLLR